MAEKEHEDVRVKRLRGKFSITSTEICTVNFISNLLGCRFNVLQDKINLAKLKKEKMEEGNEGYRIGKAIKAYFESSIVDKEELEIEKLKYETGIKKAELQVLTQDLIETDSILRILKDKFYSIKCVIMNSTLNEDDKRKILSELKEVSRKEVVEYELLEDLEAEE